VLGLGAAEDFLGQGVLAGNAEFEVEAAVLGVFAAAGAAAVQAVADKRWGHMVALQSPHLVTIPIDEVLKETKRVDPAHDVVQAARMMGISFGD